MLENKIQGCLEKMPQTHLIIGSDVEKMLPPERENLYHLLLASFQKESQWLALGHWIVKVYVLG